MITDTKSQHYCIFGRFAVFLWVNCTLGFSPFAKRAKTDLHFLGTSVVRVFLRSESNASVSSARRCVWRVFYDRFAERPIRIAFYLARKTVPPVLLVQELTLYAFQLIRALWELPVEQLVMDDKTPTDKLLSRVSTSGRSRKDCRHSLAVLFFSRLNVTGVDLRHTKNPKINLSCKHALPAIQTV